jgi:predicted negative regulator of RcsB-dependent stress response
MRRISRRVAKNGAACEELPEWCIEAPVAEQHDESDASSGPEKTGSEASESEQPDAEAAETDEAGPAVPVAQPLSRKKKKKRALDAPAEPSRDRNRRLREEVIGARRSKSEPRSVTRHLEAGEIVDDALARSSQAIGEWLKKNFNVVQWFIVAGIVGWAGYAIYGYRAGRAADLASGKLTAAIRAENARIGAADDSKPDPQTGLVETRPAFASDEARLKAAEQQYRAIADSGATAAATFAKLGLASVLYDQGKFADAKAAYQAVKDSKLANQQAAVKGRATEGVGLSLESLGDKDAAAKAFGELSNIDALGFNALGDYHQARLAFAAGSSEKAKDRLKDAQKHLDALAGSDSKKSPGSHGYLQQAVRDLLRRVDPSAVSASSSALTAEQLQELQEQMGSPGEGSSKGLSAEKLSELLKRMAKSPGGAAPSPAPPASAP